MRSPPPRHPVLGTQHVCRLHEDRQGQADRFGAVHQKSRTFRLVGRGADEVSDDDRRIGGDHVRAGRSGSGVSAVASRKASHDSLCGRFVTLPARTPASDRR